MTIDELTADAVFAAAEKAGLALRIGLGDWLKSGCGCAAGVLFAAARPGCEMPFGSDIAAATGLSLDAVFGLIEGFEGQWLMCRSADFLRAYKVGAEVRRRVLAGEGVAR